MKSIQVNIDSNSEFYKAVEEFVKNNHNDCERSYETELVKNIVNNFDIPLTDLEEQIDKKNLDISIRYAIFFYLCTKHRRNKDYGKYSELIDKFKNEFKNYKSVAHLEAMYLTEVLDGREETILAIKLSEEAIECAPQNCGFLHCYTVIIAEGFENDYLNHQEDKHFLDKACKYIKKAIELAPDYPKFYATQGRLLAIGKNFKEAKYYIKKAIDKEQSSVPDYSLRINDYQKHLLSVISNEHIEEIENKLKRFETNLKDTNHQLETSKIKNIELLAFFAALLSLIIGSIEIASNQPFKEAFLLINSLCGLLLIVFSCLSPMLFGIKYFLKTIPVLIVGFLILYTAINIFNF